MKILCKRLFCALLCACVLFSLSSCQTRVSSYAATMLIRSNAGGSLSVRFSTMQGRLCDSFRKSEAGEGALSFTASLEEGAMAVFYAVGRGELAPLFSLEGGESVSDVGGYIEGAKGARIHIVIETDGKCKGGDVRIDFNNGTSA